MYKYATYVHVYKYAHMYIMLMHTCMYTIMYVSMHACMYTVMFLVQPWEIKALEIKKTHFPDDAYLNALLLAINSHNKFGLFSHKSPPCVAKVTYNKPEVHWG